MPLDHHERRTSVRLASIIDGALDLAEQCGWRYAIAYLISEKVPSPIIQRLLSGGGKIRRASTIRHDAPCWTASDADGMKSLFDSLRQRRPHESCLHGDVPRASRNSRFQEID